MMLRNSRRCVVFVAELFRAARSTSCCSSTDAAPRIERQRAIEVVHMQRAVAEAERQLAALEHGAVLIAEDRQQHLVGRARGLTGVQSMSKKRA